MNKCYSEIIDNIPITRWCPFHDGKISIDNETMNDIDEDTRYTVLEWIKWRIVPAKKFNFHHSSYGIKHRLQEELNIYLTNNQFKHAMLMCGYLPKYENETNWIYAISDKSPCFHSENDKNYMLIVEAAKLKKAKRLLKAAVEDMNKEADCGICLHDNDGECPIEVASCEFKWRYADEALALIGEDTNVPASAEGTNVGHKSGGWISCKDNMPDTLERGLSKMYSDCCLVCDAFGWVGMAYYITDGQKSWWEFADAQNKNKIDWTEVTHWQPLPEPPKDGDT